MEDKFQFRIWSFLDKCFHYFTLEEGIPQGIAGGISEPQQYIGLKDKHGKKIYEGDIIKETHYDDFFDKKGFTYLGTIKHTAQNFNGEYQFSAYGSFPDIKDTNWRGNNIKKDCEIVGNIFEK